MVMDPFSNLLLLTFLLITAVLPVQSEDPYVNYEWDVKYATLSPMGVPQQVITINNEFPGPRINCTSNNNIIVNVINHLDEPFLFTWNGIQQRKNGWIDGMPGTNCPIPPGTNYTYKFQVKDQIGSYYYYPTTGLHRAAGGYGPITVHSRPLIPIPFPKPADEFIVLAGDWYSENHAALKKKLDGGQTLGKPAGVIINGKHDAKEPMFTVAAGKTYQFRVCNVGMKNSINVRIQGHPFVLAEVEGSHVLQNKYDSLDVHLGQCNSILVTFDKPPKDYLMVISARFCPEPLTSTAVIRYKGSNIPAAPELPKEPEGMLWSLDQFKSIRWDLNASAARPNKQGTFHFGKIDIKRTIKLVSSSSTVDGKLRYALNGVSHIDPETPLKLAEHFGVGAKVFKYNLIKDGPAPDAGKKITLAPNVLNVTYKDFIQIVFENHEKAVQSYHVDGYAFFAIGMGQGVWTPEAKKNYNLVDSVSRNTIQVYPDSWTAIIFALDNWGLWNLRSVALERNYLGQQLYLNVQTNEKSFLDENPMPENELLCGIVKTMPRPALKARRLGRV